jgi:hypothetical protein
MPGKMKMNDTVDIMCDCSFINKFMLLIYIYYIHIYNQKTKFPKSTHSLILHRTFPFPITPKAFNIAKFS